VELTENAAEGPAYRLPGRQAGPQSNGTKGAVRAWIAAVALEPAAARVCVANC
jgi:hypothetical protein